MTKMQLATTVGAIVLLLFSVNAQAEDKSRATLFEPGIISTGSEYGVTFSPDGKVVYFTRGSGIFWARKSGEVWSQPQLTNFSKGEWIKKYASNAGDIKYFNWDPVISPDGSKLYFMSHGLVGGRIIDGEDGDIDLWFVEREKEGFAGDTWGAPKHLGNAINSADHNEGALGAENDGTIYFFSSGRADGFGAADIYLSRRRDGKQLPSINIGSPINTPAWEGHVYADPTGGYILFISNFDHPDAYGSCDIYVSRKTAAGWGQPVNLGPNVNTDQCEITPSLSADGTHLFFGRIENRELDIRNIYSIELGTTNFYDERQNGD